MTTMRETLLGATADALRTKVSSPIHDYQAAYVLDVILRELRKPSDGMIKARSPDGRYWQKQDAETWEAMIDHLLSEGNDA